MYDVGFILLRFHVFFHVLTISVSCILPFFFKEITMTFNNIFELSLILCMLYDLFCFVFHVIFYCFNNMFMLDYFIKDVYFDANNKTNTFIYKNDIFYSLPHILTSAIYPWFRSLLPQFYFRTLPDVTSALPHFRKLPLTHHI